MAAPTAGGSMPGHALLTGLLSSLFFVTLNVGMNIYMKWLFAKGGGDFALPWTMLAVQQLQAYLLLQPCLVLMHPSGRWGWDVRQGGNNDEETLGWDNMLQVLAVTALFCLNVGLNSLSLVQISITLNQTVRAFLPVGVLVLASCLEQRAYPSHSYITTAVLVGGIALTCWGSPDFQPYGFCLAFGSTLVAAVGTSLNGRLLSSGPFTSGKYGVIRLTMLQSVPAFFIFALVAVMTEGPVLWEKLFCTTGHWTWYQQVGLVSISSALALLSNLARCFLVAATSALMETLAGNVKVGALCIIDHQIFGTALYIHNYAGISLTFMGFSIHVLLQYATKDSSERQRDSSASAENIRGRTDSQGNKHAKSLNRPRLISAAETGLAAEHVAVELGRQHTKSRSASAEAGIPEIPRPRSMTWPATGPAQSEQMWAGVDLSLLIEVPTWLSGVNPPGSPEDYSPLSVTSLSPVGRFTGNSPSRTVSAQLPVPATSARSRFFSDPTDTQSTRSRDRVLEDMRQSLHLQSVIEEEQVDDEPRTPLNLDWL